MIEHAIEEYLAAYNAKDVPGMLRLLDEQIVFENVSNASGVMRTQSKAEFETLANASLAYFSQRRQVVRFQVLTAEAAAVEIDYEATLAIDFPNGLRTGDELRLRGVSVFELKNGKFTRISDYS